MSGVVRDMQCSMDVGKMAELGRYAEEFIAYGFFWIDNQQRFYYLSENCMETYRFKQEKMLEQKIAFPVHSHLERRIVPSGMRQEYNQETKIILAKKIQNQYTAWFSNEVVKLIDGENTTIAFEVIAYLQNKLEGTFDRVRLNYFEAILQAAYIAKKISKEQYNIFCQWLRRNYKQMEDDIVVEEQYHRMWGGFCYRAKNGIWKLYMNAQPSNVYEQWERKMMSGYLVLPIFWKRYWFSSVTEGQKLKDIFKREFIAMLQDDFGECALKIKTMTPAIDKEKFQEMYREIAQKDNREEMDAFILLGQLWDLNIFEVN